ncbi:hypothetical protein C2845_PM11G14820 [Panicum miliaceum]|uniref:Uncharacterized protein n=1 Tax=Panicum miliaceum TaxID=4540 RepID=A0A3L6RV87_PANMI|nr:hypothetical protein C2845_PM11G14820 [Panicum miliaceum]
MEVDVSRAQSSLVGVDDPNAKPAWVSMGLYFPWSSRTLLYLDVHRSSKRARVAAASEAILPELPATPEHEDEKNEDEEDQLPATHEPEENEEDAIKWVDGATGSN